MEQKQRPILFSSPMIEAILEGRKTMTRRIIKSKHESGLFQVSRRLSDGQITSITSLDWDEMMVDPSNDIRCPYGEVGDTMWVRETWTKVNNPNDNSFHHYAYRADGCPLVDGFAKWKPSIFMPKEACRIWLEITGIKVERVQDISLGDAEKEGVEAVPCGPVYCFTCGFADLWKKINGEESWNQNPFVWAISFKRIEEPKTVNP